MEPDDIFAYDWVTRASRVLVLASRQNRAQNMRGDYFVRLKVF